MSIDIREEQEMRIEAEYCRCSIPAGLPGDICKRCAQDIPKDYDNNGDGDGWRPKK